MANLYGIDVSAHQPHDITDLVKYDFAVVKISGNPNQNGYKYNYVNPVAEDQLKYAFKKTGLVGGYHFAYGLSDPTIEADFFVKMMKEFGYLNKAILVIDYEGPAIKKGRTWIKKLCDRVKEKAGYAPVLYSYGAVISSQNLGSLGYPIWCANYYKGENVISGYKTDGMKIAYDKAKLWQFTGSCKLPGYSGKLDANVFFGTKTDWKKLANIKVKPSVKTEIITQWYKVVSPDGMNVRSAYKTSGKIITTIKKDTSFKAVKKHGNWVYSEKYKGWVCIKAKNITYLKPVDEPKPKEVKKPVENKQTEVKKPVENKLTQVAKDVISGKYGNGILRTIKLKMKGYDPKEVQKEVNKLLRK